MHRTVEEALARYVAQGGHRLILHVPRCYGYIDKEQNGWWALHESLCTQRCHFPEDLLRSERIPSVHLVARYALIDQYCPEELKVNAIDQDSNKDCLVRLYLGRRRDSTVRVEEKVNCFGLRNFKLYLDQMEDLRFNFLDYAFPIADPLAIVHWEARIDVANLGFLLGGALCFAQKSLFNILA